VINYITKEERKLEWYYKDGEFNSEIKNRDRIIFICDKCGGELEQRKDDLEATVAKRIEVYLEQTEPLIAYYSRKGIIQNIDGTQEIKTVFNSILEGLRG